MQLDGSYKIVRPKSKLKKKHLKYLCIPHETGSVCAVGQRETGVSFALGIIYSYEFLFMDMQPNKGVLGMIDFTHTDFDVR